MNNNHRVICIVLDSVGVGAMPDAARYGDAGAATLKHIAEAVPELHLPNLNRMGLASIEGAGIPGRVEAPAGAFGRAAERSKGKDTITGHWELMGLVTEIPFQTFTETGFPESFIRAFEKRIGVGVLGNYAASGTEIIEKLGEQHKKTGKPIVYTSADSVFQIAADASVIPLSRLYEICEIAREMLTGKLLTGRVIARPYIVKEGSYIRTADRRDYAVDPVGKTWLDAISEADQDVLAVGKIEDIFHGKGITDSVHTADNDDGITQTLEAMKKGKKGLIFTNLVDFDAKYGHRRDPYGYAAALEAFDQRLSEIIEAMTQEDMLIITADHGNDPTFSGWNHTREYVPVLLYGACVKENISFGTLSSFADIGATAAEYLGVRTDACAGSCIPGCLEK